jgi:hypothetical protein
MLNIFWPAIDAKVRYLLQLAGKYALKNVTKMSCQVSGFCDLSTARVMSLSSRRLGRDCAIAKLM